MNIKSALKKLSGSKIANTILSQPRMEEAAFKHVLLVVCEMFMPIFFLNFYSIHSST